MTLCDRTEEVAGDWVCSWKWACPSGGVYDTLGAYMECISGFSSHPLAHALINVRGRMYVPYPTL